MTKKRLTQRQIALFDEIRVGDAEDRRMGDLLSDTYKKIVYPYLLDQHALTGSMTLGGLAERVTNHLRTFVPAFSPYFPTANVISCPLCDPDQKCRGYKVPLGMHRHLTGYGANRCPVVKALLRYRMEKSGIYIPTGL